jgi:hypothetical protein
VSLLLTAVIERFIFFVKGELPNAGLAGGAVGFFMVQCVVVASVAQVGLAAMSHRRGQCWGWLLAAIGIATWFATIAKIR